MNTHAKKRWRTWLVYILLLLVAMQAANWWKTRDAASGNLSEFSGELINGSTFTIAEFAVSRSYFIFGRPGVRYVNWKMARYNRSRKTTG